MKRNEEDYEVVHKQQDSKFTDTPNHGVHIQRRHSWRVPGFRPFVTENKFEN